jgi:hypothetical protein
MQNYRSVSIKGVFSAARARVLWYDGTLKVFGVNGLVHEIAADEPQRKPRHVRVWDVKTARGDIVMRGKCMTCGGTAWLGVMRIPADELWSREQ